MRHSQATLGGFGTLRECSLEEGPANWLAIFDKNMIPHLSPPAWREGERSYNTHTWSVPGSFGETADRTPICPGERGSLKE